METSPHKMTDTNIRDYNCVLAKIDREQSAQNREVLHDMYYSLAVVFEIPSMSILEQAASKLGCQVRKLQSCI